MATNSDQSSTRYIRYLLKFPDGMEKVFTVNLDPDTLEVLLPEVESPPEWTRLDFQQCPNCLLDASAHAHCPVAVNLLELITFLKDLVSYTEVDVCVERPERTYSTHDSLQRVAGSLMGIYMVSSGCPILNKMRPMVETHLPFSTWEETLYRIITMYLFAQYFLDKNGKEPNWNLDGLVKFYDQVQKVNVSFGARLRAIPAQEGDATINAVSILSSLATMASMNIMENDLGHWERMFMDHWS